MRNSKLLCIFAFLSLVFYSQSGYSQTQKLSKKEVKIYENAANAFYLHKNYLKALNYFEKLENNDPQSSYYKLMTGICLIYKVNERSLALKKLLEAKKENPTFNKVNFYLGKAYAVNHKFDSAVVSLQTFLKGKDLSEEETIKANHLITQYTSAKTLVKDSLTNVTIKNIGSPINTVNNEYVPIVTADETELIFTYRGPKCIGGLRDYTGKKDSTGDYFEDIMVSHKTNGRWTEPQSIGSNINTPDPDASIALSVDGQKLLVFRSNKEDNGDIYISDLDGNTWSKPKHLEGDINTNYWEGSATLSADEKHIIFASDRPGGFGGRDLYEADKNSAGKWTNVKNLGYTINTPYDEDAPFLHPDGKTLYFSSKGHNSMGGYDIFYTQLQKDGTWGKPVNVGYPVNTVYDDRYYVLSANGKTGYFSSAGVGTTGGEDIFTVNPGYFGKKPVLALVIGVVKADDKPVKAKIKVTNETTHKDVGTYYANSATGKYTLALTPGSKYKIGIEVDGYDPKVEYLDIKSLQTYVQVKHNIALYSDAYKAQHPGLKVAEKDSSLQKQVSQQVNNYKSGGSVSKYDQAVYKKILKTYGDKKSDSVTYAINVTNVKPLDSLSKNGIKINSYQQRNVVIKQLGPFATLKEANDYREALMKKRHIQIPFVQVNDHGSHKTIKQYYASEFTREDTTADTTTMNSLVTMPDTLNHNNEYTNKKALDLSSNGTMDLSDSDLNQSAYNQVINGLSFKVEIAAVKDTNDFKLGYLSKYGKIHKKTYPDGYTRYSFGPFKTLAETEKFRKNLIKKEHAAADAFTTIFVFGQRKTMAQYKNNPCADESKQKFVDFSDLIGKDLNNPKWYNELLEKAGALCATGLIFKVQIAAYRHPKNYKYARLLKFGQPVITNYPDGITRFTQGKFHTLRQAEILRQKIIKAGQKDAWVTPFYNGKRMLMEDLIKVNFYGKSIE